MDSEQVTETEKPAGWSRRVRGEPSGNFNSDFELESDEQQLLALGCCPKCGFKKIHANSP